MKNYIFISVLFFVLLIASVTFAGHHYHGHGCIMSSWDMTEMDTNEDGILSFDEYSNPHRKVLRSGFDMIDENKDGSIDQNEWRKLLEVHGMKTDS